MLPLSHKNPPEVDLVFPLSTSGESYQCHALFIENCCHDRLIAPVTVNNSGFPYRDL